MQEIVRAEIHNGKTKMYSCFGNGNSGRECRGYDWRAREREYENSGDAPKSPPGSLAECPLTSPWVWQAPSSSEESARVFRSNDDEQVSASRFLFFRSSGTLREPLKPRSTFSQIYSGFRTSLGFLGKLIVSGGLSRMNALSRWLSLFSLRAQSSGSVFGISLSTRRHFWLMRSAIS